MKQGLAFVNAVVPRVLQLALFLLVLRRVSGVESDASQFLLAFGIVPMAGTAASFSLGRSFAAGDISGIQVRSTLVALQIFALVGTGATLFADLNDVHPTVSFWLGTFALCLGTGAQIIASESMRVLGSPNYANWTAGLLPSVPVLIAGLVVLVVAGSLPVLLLTMAASQVALSAFAVPSLKTGATTPRAPFRSSALRTVQQLLNQGAGQIDGVLVALLLSPSTFAIYAFARRLVVFAIGPMTVTNSLALPHLSGNDRPAIMANTVRVSRPGALATVLALLTLPAFAWIAGSLTLDDADPRQIAATVAAMAVFELLNPATGPAMLGLSQIGSPFTAMAISGAALLALLAMFAVLLIAGISNPIVVAGALSCVGGARFVAAHTVLLRDYGLDFRPLRRGSL